ncbi:MAG: 30S ribosomal protein S4e [Candidatus Woesearchaeota archaeon]
MSNHLKSFNAPKSWTILRKVHKWIIRPAAGAHLLERALPIALLLKQLGLAKTSREVKKILNEKTVKVDESVVTEPHFAVGFMDSIQIGQKTLRCSLDQKGRLTFIEIPSTETNKKICIITGKRSIKGNKIQLNLSSGRNITVAKNEYNTGDSLVIDLPGQKISAHYPLAKGHTAFMISGKHTGQIGVIDHIEGNRLWFTKGKEKFETLKQFAFVVGKDKPAVKL